MLGVSSHGFQRRVIVFQKQFCFSPPDKSMMLICG